MIKKKVASIALATAIGLGAGFGIGYANPSPAPTTTQVTVSKVQPVNNCDIKYYFTRYNGKPDEELIRVIDTANDTLDIAIYSLTKASIADAILKANTRGVKIRVITDKGQSDSKYQAKILDSFKAVGIPIKMNTHAGLMHLKVTVADNSVVTTGSYNYSNQASTVSDEVLVIIPNKKVAQDFDKQFNKMWGDVMNYSNY